LSKLEEILRVKRAEAFRKTALKRNDFRNFQSTISSPAERLALIAKVKKASPSAGVIAPSFALGRDREGK
jgi:indole-3-glycerol phosphate synthase